MKYAINQYSVKVSYREKNQYHHQYLYDKAYRAVECILCLAHNFRAMIIVVYMSFISKSLLSAEILSLISFIISHIVL